MQIERLKVFVDVVECMSFTRAAERGFISQSAVSQQIAALEKELGVTLLLRDRKGNVSPTAEGETFYRGCVQVISAYEKTLLQVKGLSAGEEKVLFLGLLSGSKGTWLSDVMQRFSELFPQWKIRPVYEEFGGLHKGLQSGRLDAAVAIEYGLADMPGVQYVTLQAEEPRLLMSCKHPLAGRSAVRPEELSGETFVTIGQEWAEDSFRHWMKERRREGIEIRNVEIVESASAQRMMVELNAAVAVQPVFLDSQYDMERCRAVRLEGTQERVRYVIAYRPENGGEALQTFIRLTKEYFSRLAAENAGYSENS